MSILSLDWKKVSGRGLHYSEWWEAVCDGVTFIVWNTGARWPRHGWMWKTTAHGRTLAKGKARMFETALVDAHSSVVPRDMPAL